MAKLTSLPDCADSDASFSELIARLRKWKAYLLYKLGSKRQAVALEKISSYLVRFQSLELEIPGQYLKSVPVAFILP